MNVVTRAMMTIIEKSGGEITFRSNPTLRMMSSIRPRVFISTPSEAEFRQLRPPTLAAMLVPPTFPITATAMIRTQ